MKKLLVALAFIMSVVSAQAQIGDTTSLRSYINSTIVPNTSKSITAQMLSNILNGQLNVLPGLLNKYYDSIWITAGNLYVKKNGFTANYSLIASETDPTIYSWAKASVKPSYSWSEINSKPSVVLQADTIGKWIGIGWLPSFVPKTTTINSYPLSSNILLTKSDVGLSNVPNTDATNPANISQSSSYRFATDAEKSTWNGKEPAITAGSSAQYYRGDKTMQTLDKTAVGLSNVDNTSDANKPVSTAQATSIATKQPTLVSGTNIRTVNGNSLLGSSDLSVSGVIGYTPENVANKAVDFNTLNNTLYPSVQAVKTFVDASLVSLVDDRGNWSAALNTFPTTGGSGTSGGVVKGDLYFINANGVLGTDSIFSGDQIRALVDAPGQTVGNWAILRGKIPYTPENIIHKSDATTLGYSSLLYPTQNAVKVYIDAAVINGNTAYSDRITSFGTIGTTPNAQGGNISSNTLYLQPADGTYGGIVSNTTQHFAGSKLFDGSISITDLSLGVAATSFLTTVSLGSGEVRYRTASQVLSDIGAAPVVTGGYVPLSGGNMTGNLVFTGTNGVFLSPPAWVSGTPVFMINRGTDGALVGASTAQVQSMLSLGSNAYTNTAYQPLVTNLTSIGGLTNAAGWLYNNGSGIFSYSIPTTVSGSAGSVANAVTFNNGGAGATSGTTFNGSAAQTISYNTIGASPLVGSSSITILGAIASGSIPYSLLTGIPTIPTQYLQKTGGVITTLTAGDQIETIDGTGTFFSNLNNGVITTGVVGGNRTGFGSSTMSFLNPTYQLDLQSRNITANRTVYFQNKSFTVADSADVATKLPLSGGTITGRLYMADGANGIKSSGYDAGFFVGNGAFGAAGTFYIGRLSDGGGIQMNPTTSAVHFDGAITIGSTLNVTGVSTLEVANTESADQQLLTNSSVWTSSTVLDARGIYMFLVSCINSADMSGIYFISRNSTSTAINTVSATSNSLTVAIDGSYHVKITNSSGGDRYFSLTLLRLK